MTDAVGGRPIGGTYDLGDTLGHRVLRVKAIRCAQLVYLLEQRREQEPAQPDAQPHDPETCQACQATKEETGQ